MAMLRLVKYLKNDLEIEGEAVPKAELFNEIISQSHSKQIILSIKKNYKVYRDMSIEIPFDFEEPVLDEFITQLFF